MRQVKRRQQGRTTSASKNNQSFSKKVKKKGCGCGKKRSAQ
ncbi:hypothetical protein [Bacillus glycinifermentans]|nr:hypothetical protein [Bacillus glycinifermentans]